MSDTTPTPRPDDEPTPLADETAREHSTGEQPLTTSSDPADHTDTGVAPTLPPSYEPVSASNHVAPEPDVPSASSSDTSDTTGPTSTADAATAAATDEEPAAQPAPPVVAEPTPVEEQHERPEATPATATATPAAATPAATATAAPAPAAAQTEEPTPAQTGYAGPTYLQTPTAPKKRGNRGLGILIAILAAVVFGAADLAATYGILLLRYGTGKTDTYFTSYLEGWEFWIPLAVFTAAFIALVAIVNRARWWAYVLGSVFVAALVFIAFFAAALVTSKAWNFTPGEFSTFVHTYFESNIVYLWVATVVTFIALEIVTWFGAWIAFHGQVAKRRNIEAREAYEAELEASTTRP